jgi:ankyrin repeat protein
VNAVDNPRTKFIEAATWHGPLEPAQAILAAHPELMNGDIHTAAILGDDVAVRRILAADPAAATAQSEPYDGTALVHLCLSKYLRLDPARSPAFLRATEALLDAGADPNGGFWTRGKFPEFETPLYGAAGVAHHAGLTRLLVERGADPNDNESVYHSPESSDLDAMKVLVETGRLTATNLAMMLIRKCDWHDHEGVKYLLGRGADPNLDKFLGLRAIHHSIARDNSLEIVTLLLDHGGDPTLTQHGVTGVTLAARRGRGDLLTLFERRGIPLGLTGVDRLIAACARDESATIQAYKDREPELVQELLARGGRLLAEFSGTANAAGVRQLLDLGVDITALYEGDGYFDIAPNSTALHVAAWRGWHQTLRFLIERGAPVNVRDGKGRTPLALAVKACVNSYWTHRRSPESARALLDAGASASDVGYPSGYEAVDELLRARLG